MKKSTATTVNLKNDAEQAISYQGIKDGLENGNELLGKKYDLDEVLNAKAESNEADKKKRRQRVLGAYKALTELRDEGKVASIGVSSKNI
eukprot:COSAG02_NODE_62098_length_267_cov_0.190476_1_plen_89_part_11